MNKLLGGGKGKMKRANKASRGRLEKTEATEAYELDGDKVLV